MLFLEGKHVPALQTQTMKNFAAIDFETANQCHSSVCSVGVVVVRDGKVTDKFYSLIYPHPYFFSYWNTRVHGLTLEDVADAPEFPDAARRAGSSRACCPTISCTLWRLIADTT